MNWDGLQTFPILNRLSEAPGSGIANIPRDTRTSLISDQGAANEGYYASAILSSAALFRMISVEPANSSTPFFFN